jgi:hypothetical protein
VVGLPVRPLSLYSTVGILDKVHQLFNTGENGPLVKIG